MGRGRRQQRLRGWRMPARAQLPQQTRGMAGPLLPSLTTRLLGLPAALPLPVPPQDVVISSDGQFCLTGSWDGTLRLWDINTGATTRRFLGHTKDVLSVAFSADNRQVGRAGGGSPGWRPRWRPALPAE